MKARLPKGMGGGPQNMQSMIRQAQAELDVREYETQAGGGAVKVKINGKREILSLTLSPEIVDPDDIETLADAVTAAVNEAIKKVEAENSETMNKITGNLNVPGMF